VRQWHKWGTPEDSSLSPNFSPISLGWNRGGSVMVSLGISGLVGIMEGEDDVMAGKQSTPWQRHASNSDLCLGPVGHSG